MLDDDGYPRQLARLRTMRSDAAKKVEAANAELDDEWLFEAQRTLELAKSAAELWVSRSGAEKRALLEMMVSNPTLTGRKVAYELKKPFAVLAEIRRRVLGAPRRIRTYDPRIRSPMLYPAELGVRSGRRVALRRAFVKCAGLQGDLLLARWGDRASKR